MEEEVDIYGDLPGFNVDDFTNVTEQNKQISDRCAELEKKVDELTKELKSARVINNNLEVNLASLYKTAKAEITRKDRMIAELRLELDNIQFRRGIHSKPNKTCSKPNENPSKLAKESNSTLENDKETWKLPDTTEFVCDNPPCSDDFEDEIIEQTYPQNKLVSTVFGERLQKKILEEQEQERQQKIHSSMMVERNENKSSSDNVKSDLHTNDTLKPQEIILGQYVASSVDIAGVACTSNENTAHSKNHQDKKRILEQQIDVQNSKIMKIDDGRDMCRDSSRRRNDRDDSDSKSSCVNVAPKRQSDVPQNSENKHSYRRHEPSRAFDDGSPHEVIHEDNGLKNANKKSGTTLNHGNDTSHSRLASRLILLSEGIDPDINSKYSDKRFKRQTFEGKRHTDVGNERTSRSRSRSTDRGRWGSRDKRRRSPSRTSDKYSRDRQRSRHRDDRYKDSRDRFDKRSGLKTRDGDTFSEFSRDISDLRGKIDKTNKRGSIRNKENCIRDRRRDTSRTESRSRSGSTELIAQKRKTDRLSRRSRSRDRHNDRINDENFGNLDTNSRQHMSAVSKTETIKDSGIACNKNETVTGDAVSLLSLEDGEIIDSTDSSPKKTYEITKTYDKHTVIGTKDRSAPKELKHEIDMVCTTSSMKVEETKINFNSLFESIPKSSMETPHLLSNMQDDLNSSKDERIDNIAKFISNYSVNQHPETSETVVRKNSCEIKNRDFSHTTAQKIQDSSEKTPHDTKNSMNCKLEIASQADPFGISSTETISPINIIETHSDKQWSLIEIKYDVKNDEENRRYRIALQNARMEQASQKSGTPQTNVPQPMSTEDAIQTPHSEKMYNKAEANSEQSDSNMKAEFAVDPLKTTDSKGNTPATPLKSAYFAVRNKMKLTDADSNDSTKFMLLDSMETALNQSENSKQVPENEDDPISLIQPKIIPNDEFKDQYARSSHTEGKLDQNNKSKKNPGQESVKTKSPVTNKDTINASNGSERVSDTKCMTSKNRTDSIEELLEKIDSKVEARTLDIDEALNETGMKQGNDEISACSSVLVNRITDEVQKIRCESEILDAVMDSQTRNTSCAVENKNQVATSSTSISKADTQPPKILAGSANNSPITMLKTKFSGDSMDANEETSKVTSESEEQEGPLQTTEQSRNNTLHASNKRKLKSDMETSGEDEEKSTQVKSRIEASTGKSIKKLKIIQYRRKRPIQLEDSSTLLTVINSDSTRESSTTKKNS